MILTTDPKTKFPHQLTEWAPSIYALEFALQHFRTSQDRDVIVRQKQVEHKLWYAAFTEGTFTERKEYTITELKQVRKYKVVKEVS